MDGKLNFVLYVEMASRRASVNVRAVARLMPNIGGPSLDRRRLLASVSTSILLYGAPMWTDVLDRAVHAAKLKRVQKAGLLRVASSYRTSSTAALQAITDVPPIDLLARERREVFQMRRAAGPEDAITTREAARMARTSLIAVWQQRWDNEEKGRWTYQLIPNLTAWCARRHRELSFHTTQLLTGHGCINVFLNGIGKAALARCLHCLRKHDDAEHTLFHCTTWRNQRREAEVTRDRVDSV